MRLWRMLLSFVGHLRTWAHHHGGEFLWAAVFALVVGIPAAVYFAEYITDLPPYRIYVIAGSHYLTKSPTDLSRDTKQQFESSFPKKQIAGVNVELRVEPLRDDDPRTAEEKANELVSRSDTLMVIGHLDSEPTETSLPIYLKARPQVPFIASVQTDDGLLDKACKRNPNERLESSSCDDGQKPLPYFQLSPTNLEQARWAIRFATERSRRKFLIIDNDAFNSPYADSLASDYARGIREYNDTVAEEDKANHKIVSSDQVLSAIPVQMRVLSDEVLWEQLKDNDIDCLLYAGGFDGTDSLLKRIAELKRVHRLKATTKDVEEKTAAERPLMVILDDSVVEDRFSGASFELSPVNVTDQADAADYNRGVSVYGLDAIAIASQLIDDLNARGTRGGFDWRFRLRILLHLQTVEDARRNLVSVIQKNFYSRSSYFGSDQTVVTPPSRNVYAFDGYTRANGMFHVWERTKIDSGSVIVDVDRWHPLKHNGNTEGPDEKKPETKIALKPSEPVLR